MELGFAVAGRRVQRNYSRIFRSEEWKN
jgi:hypothetical protein